MSLPSSSYSKLPRALRLLAQHGVAALRPSLDKGRYIAPMIPRRIAADVRKRAIVQGTYGSFSLPIGGWDPAWDETKKMFVMKPFRGHSRDRTRKERYVVVHILLLLVIHHSLPLFTFYHSFFINVLTYPSSWLHADSLFLYHSFIPCPSNTVRKKSQQQ